MKKKRPSDVDEYMIDLSCAISPETNFTLEKVTGFLGELCYL